MSSLFCRHNRFTADCPICSKGTVLDSSRAAERPRSRSTSRSPRAKGSATPRQFTGPHVSAGPYTREEDTYEVRLEKVPGGVRMAQWSRGSLEKAAPELPGEDLAALVTAALEKGLIEGPDAEALRAGVLGGHRHAMAEQDSASAFGASAGRAGDLKEELRVERIDDGRVRVGRWLFWPGRGWELQEAPPMFPVARYAEALAAAAERGLLSGAPGVPETPAP